MMRCYHITLYAIQKIEIVFLDITTVQESVAETMSKGCVFLVYTEGPEQTSIIGGAFLTIEEAEQCILDQNERDEMSGDPSHYCLKTVPLGECFFTTEPIIL
jgi:hypothetical protein